MIHFAGRGILLDIEGTTSSVRYVYDVLFPFARRELAAFLETHWDRPEVVQARELLARDAGASSFAAWCGPGADPSAARRRVLEEAQRLMDLDAKATGLKELQGLVWRAGYESGTLCSHVFPDVPPALKAWKDHGLDLRIYSSGSAAAQRLFFGRTEFGDLSAYFQRFYDTTMGSKREPKSYEHILADWALPGEQVLFLSDVPAELDAARASGLRTGLVLRPDNAFTSSISAHDSVTSFAEVIVTSSPRRL